MPKALLETDLSAPCQKWLSSMGYVVWAEVPLDSGQPDWLGLRGKKLIAVEMKLRLTKKCRQQAVVNQLVVDETWCFVGTKPGKKALFMPEVQGVGVAWFDGATKAVTVVCHPQPRFQPFPQRRKQALGMMSRRAPGGVAGRQGA